MTYFQVRDRDRLRRLVDEAREIQRQYEGEPMPDDAFQRCQELAEKAAELDALIEAKSGRW